MANSVFLDTSGWLALLNATDALHQRASIAWLDLGRLRYRVVLTDWVVAETGNGLGRTRAKREFADQLREFLQSRNVEIVPIDRSLLDQSLEFYCRHDDKQWGLVDCASFLVMKDRGIVEAFTSDVHFEQAGLVRILAS